MRSCSAYAFQRVLHCGVPSSSLLTSLSAVDGPWLLQDPESRLECGEDGTCKMLIPRIVLDYELATACSTDITHVLVTVIESGAGVCSVCLLQPAG